MYRHISCNVMHVMLIISSSYAHVSACIRFRMGLFDPLENQEYTTIGIEKINATAHYDLVLDAALQSLVLLKNDALTLPFTRTKSVAGKTS